MKPVPPQNTQPQGAHLAIDFHLKIIHYRKLLEDGRGVSYRSARVPDGRLRIVHLARHWAMVCCENICSVCRSLRASSSRCSADGLPSATSTEPMHSNMASSCDRR